MAESASAPHSAPGLFPGRPRGRAGRHHLPLRPPRGAWPLLLVVGLALALAWAAAPAHAQDRPVIEEIAIEGATDLEQGLLLTNLLSKVGSPMEANQVTRDVKSLFALAYFQNVRAYAEELESGGIRLIFQVTPRPRLAYVRLEGFYILSKTERADSVVIKAGNIYNPATVDRVVENLRQAYRSKGYYSVGIESHVEKISESQYGVTFAAEETPKVYVTDIRTHGNKVFSELEIRRFMLTSEVDCFDWANQSGVLDEMKINQDLQIISAEYLKIGYIRLFIDKPKVRMVHNRDFTRVKVEMTFNEGAQYFTGKLDVTGDVLGDKQLLLDMLQLEEGEVYNPFSQNRDVFNLSNLYQEQGYAFARVVPDAKIDDERKIVDVTYRITKGEKAYIGRIEIQGNRETRDYVVRREFEVHENELYNGRKLRESQANLQALGYFTPAMSINTETADVDNVLDVVAKLEESETGSFQAQLGYSEQTQLTIAASLSKGNFLGRGQTLRVRAEGGQQGVRQNYSLDFIEPHLFDSEISSDSSVAYRNLQDLTEQNRGSYREIRFAQGFGYPFYRLFSFGLSFDATNRDFSRDNERDAILRTLTPSITYNTVNHPIFPSAGSRITFSVSQIGGELLGGTTEYRRYRLRWQKFISLNDNNTVILTGRFRLGWLEAVGGNEIPGEDRFRLGGITSLHGYSYLDIGGPFGRLERELNAETVLLLDENGNPILDSDGNPIYTTVDGRTRGLSESDLENLRGGGISERLFNVELIYPLAGDNVRGVIFYDAGNVNAERRQYKILGENEPKFFQLKQAVGGGVRLITPLGVFRFEYGFKLIREKGETPDKFDFTISTLF